MDYADIKVIFENYCIGEKFREHSSPDTYLRHNIEKAKEFSNLTEEERLDPLFISGAIHKSDNGKYSLKIVNFQEFMYKKHMLKFLEKERAFFRYNGQCYEQCSDDRLNNICQIELGLYRELFTPASKANFIHYAIGNDLIDVETAFVDQVRYLTLQNGLYDLSSYELIPHDPEIFTTNLLPYDYDPDAECPRWLQYLDEVFMSDAATIRFVQEAVGYAFHKSIPIPALFFLIGDGGNGKSVFIDVSSSLCGKENVSNISLNRLNDEKYLPELFGKMMNVSGETPNARCMNTDLIKSVVAGDWVTGREVYKKPSKFKPYAKHYLGMNTLPEIEDNTYGMWRRIYVIEFPHKFSEREADVELTGKLLAELSGIFNWALEGYRRLRDQGFIFSKSPSMEESKSRYKQKNSSVVDFAESQFVEIFDSEDSVPFKDVYQQYRKFCSDEGIKRAFSKKDFRSALVSEGYRIENSTKHANQLRIIVY
jgi:putative DNA primase/helicase